MDKQVEEKKEKKFDIFKKILQTTQEQLKTHVESVLKTSGYKPVVGDGFVYAEGKLPILLVAHLDTVHKITPTDIFYDSEQDVMWSPQGIGGDDRCGVYAILKLINNYKPYVLFTEDEEKGCIGAKKVVDIIKKPDVKFILEIDRRGAEDCVFYRCDNKEFQEYIESFGFETAIGSYTDICELSDEWDIASVNVSAGYYREHTQQEYIKLNELQKTYERVKDILNDIGNAKEYKYEKKVYTYNAYKKNDKKDDKKDDKKKDDEEDIQTILDLEEDKPRLRYHQGNYYDEWGYVDDNGNYIFWSEYNGI